MLRGIIAPSGLIEIFNNRFVFQRTLTPQELRYYILYWDKVVIPTTNLMHFAIQDEEVLMETGVITRPRVEMRGAYYGADIAHAFLGAQAIVAESLLSKEGDTDWVVHQMGNNFSLPDEKQILKRSIKVELAKLLPVPEENVPVIEIMEFKERRRSELTDLHQSLDEAYIEILSSPDPTLTKKAAIQRLDDAVNNLNKVSYERWKKTKKFDFSAELNVDGNKIVTGAAAGFAFDFYNSGLAVPIGTVIGGMASLMKLSAKVTASFEPAKNHLKLSYLSKATEENILNQSR